MQRQYGMPDSSERFAFQDCHAPRLRVRSVAGPVLSAGFSSCAAAAGRILAWAFNLGRKPGLRLDINADYLNNLIEGSGMAYLTASNGWKALMAAIAVYEVVCAEEELLSRGFDRLMVRHPVWPRVVVLAFALHLINWIPQRVDPVSKLFHVTRKVGR